MTIDTIANSQLSTPMLDAMLKTNESIINNMKIMDIEPKELIGWRNKLLYAISLRKEIAQNQVGN